MRKRLMVCWIMLLMVICKLKIDVNAQGTVGNGIQRLVDDADLLDDSEEELLLTQLDEISERQQMDVVVVTVDSMFGKTAESYADDYYDENGYGFGQNKDGILLLVSMEEREWHITTTGLAITYFTDAGLEYIEDIFLDDLSDGEYYQAFEKFASECDAFINQGKTGEPYDIGNIPEEELDLSVVDWILVVVAIYAIGFVVALLVALYKKSKTKTVHEGVNANNYAGQLHLHVKQDQYIRSTTRTVEIPHNNGNSSGGSSVHVGSSGTSHGGSGGKF